MKRPTKMAALAIAAAVAVATAAAMLSRFAGGDRKSMDAELVGDKVLEMLFCFPGFDCGAKQRARFSDTGASGAFLAASRNTEAT